MAHFKLIILVVLPLFFIACEEKAAPALAHIDAVGPDAAEPGDILKLEGRGFVEGRCIVTLTGAFKPDGIRPSKKRAVSVEGTAVSDRRIEVLLTPRTMKKLVDEPTTFNGKVVVDFPISDSAVQINAEKKEITIGLRPGGLGVAAAAQRLRKAEAHLYAMGIEVSAASDSDGLVVQTVKPDSVADQGGVASGDRILSINGKPLLETSDFSVVDPGEAHRFEMVSPMGIIREVRVVAISTDVLDSDELTAVVLSCIALGLFLAFAAPNRRQKKRPLVDTFDPITQAVGVGVVSIPIALIPALSVLALDGFPLLILLFAVQGGGLALLMILDTGRGIFSSVARLLIVPLVLGTAAFLSSGLGVGDIVTIQQSTPYGPHAFANPFSFLLFATSVSMLWPVRGDRPGARLQRWRSIAIWAASTAAAATITLCLLGGWNTPFISMTQIDLKPSLLVAGSLSFLLKTWMVIITARWFAASRLVERRRGVRSSDAPVVRTLLLLTAAAAAILFNLFTGSSQYQAAGQIIATALFATFASLLLILSIKETVRGFVRSANRKLRHAPSSETV
jgi:hypothetical protein